MVLLKERIQLNKPPEQIPLSKIRVPILPILPMKERHVEGTTPWRSIFLSFENGMGGMEKTVLDSWELTLTPQYPNTLTLVLTLTLTPYNYQLT